MAARRMGARWLVKTEPRQYSFQDLQREGRTAWTGVKNPQAQAHLKAMAAGDGVVVYHSGERLAVGLAEVARGAYPEPAGGEGLVCVDLEAVEPLPEPVSLDLLKREPSFAGSPLLRQGRLSVLPLSAAQWQDLVRLARSGARR